MLCVHIYITQVYSNKHTYHYHEKRREQHKDHHRNIEHTDDSSEDQSHVPVCMILVCFSVKNRERERE